MLQPEIPEERDLLENIEACGKGQSSSRASVVKHYVVRIYGGGRYSSVSLDLVTRWK
jgi:hypothetical protein